MTIDEAIKELTDLEAWYKGQCDNKGEDAILLGIEALKLVRDYKKKHIGSHYTPMPGETEE